MFGKPIPLSSYVRKSFNDAQPIDLQLYMFYNNVDDKIAKMKTRWPWNKNSLSDGQKGIGRLKAEARIKHSEKPRGWLRRVISRSFELLIYPFKYAYMKVRRTDPWPRGRKSPGLERKIKHETQTPVSQEDLLRLLDGETFLGENASLMSRIEKTHGSLKSKFELILHGQKAEASKTITELTEELRIPLDSSAIHGYIIQFMREYALYPSSDIDLLGHLALCLGSLSSDKLTHITSDELHERVLKYTAMNLKRKVIDQISKSPEMVDPLIKGIFLPTEHIVQVTSKQLFSSTSFLAPKAHQIITADEEVLCDISPDVKSTKGDISVFLQAKRRAIKSLEEDQSLAEVDQSSLLFYLYILEKEFRSKYLVVPFRSKYLVVPQSNQNDAFQSDRLYIFPKELKTKLKNMSALVHRHIVEKLSASSISKS
ncbi:hypothetical protein DFH28DRAFT_946696 [Melampsora americana]|nr:hypothetical protein DFH28DRAFT_946696 [Melampsora americana]